MTYIQNNLEKIGLYIKDENIKEEYVFIKRTFLTNIEFYSYVSEPCEILAFSLTEHYQKKQII